MAITGDGDPFSLGFRSQRSYPVQSSFVLKFNQFPLLQWLKGMKNYILRKKEDMRQALKIEKKGVPARYYQLMTGHAVIAPYLKKQDEEKGL
jgi:hypothetical protein